MSPRNLLNFGKGSPGLEKTKHRGDDDEQKYASMKSQVSKPDFGEAARFNLEDLDTNEAAKLFRKMN